MRQVPFLVKPVTYKPGVVASFFGLYLPSVSLGADRLHLGSSLRSFKLPLESMHPRWEGQRVKFLSFLFFFNQEDVYPLAASEFFLLFLFRD